MESTTLKLIMLQGPREGETLHFNPGNPIRIGRIIRGNTVPIKDTGISTKHLSIESKSGKWLITDLDSSNGTFLNDVKLPPLTPFDLRYGDSVKIGEFTSIKVELEVVVVVVGQADDGDDEGRSRCLPRNPRRRVAVDNVEQENRRRSRRRRLGSLKNEEGEIELLESVVEIPGPVVEKTRDRASGSQENNGNDYELSGVSDVRVEGSKNVGQGRPPRGGVRRGISLKDKEIESVEAVEEIKPRRGRPPRGAKKMNSVVINGSKSEGMAISKANEGMKEKCNVQDEALHSEGIRCLEENVSRNRSDSRGKIKTLHEAAMDASIGEDTMEGLTSVPRRESTSMSGAKISNVNVGDDVDLEKVTLGEWLDLLEVYLPKQIVNETEEMIVKMEEKAKRFHEFMLQQKKVEAVS